MVDIVNVQDMLCLALGSDELGQLQVARALALRLAQQRHRRSIEASRAMRAIESLRAESVEIVAQLDQPRGRYIQFGEQALLLWKDVGWFAWHVLRFGQILKILLKMMKLKLLSLSVVPDPQASP